MAATRRKLLTLILLGAAVAAILLLAASLAQVRLPPGQPFTLKSDQPLKPAPAFVPAEMGPLLRVLLRSALTVVLALLPFSIYYLIISPEARRRVLRNLAVLGVFLLIMSTVGQRLTEMREAETLFGGLDMAALGEGGATLPPVEFSGHAPPALVLVISLILAGILVGLAAWLIYTLVRGRRPPVADAPYARLAAEAEGALTAIAAGGDLRDTVIRCYVEMSRLVREGRGIHRQRATTAREFAAQLTAAGLPGDSVRELTLLFEAVRYGAREPDPAAQARAVACLAAIAAECRALAGR